MAVPATHSDTVNLSRRTGANINFAAGLLLLTNANVAAADTVDGLDAAMSVVNPALHSDQQFIMNRVRRSLRTDAGITNAAVLGLTTTAGLTALTDRGTDVTTYDVLD